MAKQDRIRKPKKRFSLPMYEVELGHYLIVTDTKKTEENYFYGLRDALSEELRKQIAIRVVKTKTQKLVDTCLDIINKESHYVQSWIVFDRDLVIDFDNIIKEALKNNICVGWSNPCIEVWFANYFGKSPSGSDSTSVVSQFSRIFQQQTKIKYHKADKNLYNLLMNYGNEDTAIKVAQNRHNSFLKSNIKPSDMLMVSTLYQLVKDIKKFDTSHAFKHRESQP